MKVTHDAWPGWEVWIEYKGSRERIKDRAVSHLTAEETGKGPIDVVYIAVDEDRPFRIVGRPTIPGSHDVRMRSMIDGQKLRHGGVVGRKGDMRWFADSNWTHDSDGREYDRDYRFESITFVENGPVPRELLLHGSIVVTLEAGTLGIPFHDVPSPLKKTPQGTINLSMENELTDTFVGGEVIGWARTINLYPFKPAKSIPRATIVFKYASEEVLTENFVIAPVLWMNQHRYEAPRTVWGGRTFKDHPSPLMVVYDPDLGSGWLAWLRHRRLKKFMKTREVEGEGKDSTIRRVLVRVVRNVL